MNKNKKRVAWNEGLGREEYAKHYKNGFGGVKNKGRIVSEETRIKLSLAGKNRKHTEETKHKISSAHKGMKKPWAKNSLKEYYKTHQRIPWNKGKHLSEEHKKKLKDKLSGSNNPFYGKKHTEESLKIMSIKSKFGNTGKKRTPEQKHHYSLSKQLEKHPNWLGGLSFEPYSKEWKDELKEYIRNRDENICKICNSEQSGRKFHIHHIDYDKKNCTCSNLITLCPSCHSKTNSNREYWIFKLSNMVGGMI